MTMPIRVLIVEDHPIYREGLQSALSDVPEIDVIGAVATAIEATAQVDRLRPDLVLLDLTLPDGNGLDLTRQWARAHDSPKVVILTMTRDPQVVLEAIHAGAHGFLVKGAGRADICAAINAAARAQLVFGPEITGELLAALTRRGPSNYPFPTLSTREREVLNLLIDGLTNHAIAARLHLSDKTIRNHVSNVLTKLGATSRHDAAQRARRALNETNA
jgi:DNA-binding NarL/FixJ family response regulator